MKVQMQMKVSHQNLQVHLKLHQNQTNVAKHKILKKLISQQSYYNNKKHKHYVHKRGTISQQQ